MSAPLGPLLRREVRAIGSWRALWSLLVVGGAVTAWSARKALADFADGGGADPHLGVVVPMLQSLTVVTALLFPFVVIGAFADDERRTSSLFTAQLGHRPVTAAFAKLFAVALAFALACSPALFAVLGFALAGGHVHAPALGAALLGHALLGAVVAGIAVVAVGVFDGTAAVLAVLAVCGVAWAAQDADAWWSPVASLSSFEAGVIELRLVLAWGIAALGLCLAGALLVAPAAAVEKKIARAVVVVVVAGGLALAMGFVRGALDESEAQKNSFPKAVATALAQIGDPIRVTIRMRADDDKRALLMRDVIAPLSRAARVDVKRLDVDQWRDKSYGLITYQVGVRAGESRATSADVVVPLVLELAGLKAPPLVADAVAAPHPWKGSPALPVALASLPALLGAIMLVARRR